MSEFVDNLSEVFALFGPVRAKRMFGGYGIYHDDLMFALVADDVLYLKVDAQSVATFTRQGLLPFEYKKDNKTIRLSYYTAPEGIFDDPETAREWAVLAFEVALRCRKPKRK